MILTTCITSTCAQAQVDRYKQLLLKQRDIMIALTQVMGRVRLKRITVARRLGVCGYGGITFSELYSICGKRCGFYQIKYALVCEYAFLCIFFHVTHI